MRIFPRAALLALMTLLAFSAAQASGGDKQELRALGGATAPAQGPVQTPEEIAIDNYNQGLGHRDKAWQLEKELATITGAKKASKLEGKIEKEYEKAVRNFEMAVQNRASFYQALSSLGYARRKTGDYQGSLSAYGQALQLAPDYMEAVEYQAEAHLALGRVDEAKQAYMTLFARDREKADQLMAAMKGWIADQRAGDGQASPAELAAIEEWIAGREEITVQTAKLSMRETGRDW